MAENLKPHLFLKNVHTSQIYSAPVNGRGGKSILPQRDRNAHGNAILEALIQIWQQFDQEIQDRKEQGLPIRDGEYVTFKSATNNTLKIESLDSSGVILLNVDVDKDSNQQIATVYIPENQKGKLTKKVENYLSAEKNGKPQNQPLIDKIETISRTSVENLWSSSSESLPHAQPLWCELWLASEDLNLESVIPQLKQICQHFGIQVAAEIINFPQRSVVVVKANYQQLNELISSFGLIAEIRKTEELNSFWLSQNMTENNEWINQALDLVDFTKSNNYISILDTGINNGHPLLEPILENNNRLTVNPAWGMNDIGGHGTNMAGVAVYGNLNSILESGQAIQIHHQLESVKILHPLFPNPQNSIPFITLDAVNRAIINNPESKRIFCMAVTTDFQVDFGKPSTYSAVLDEIIFGSDYNDKKIFVVSAGNVREEYNWKNYPESNLNLSVESPAQSWNAITIGAYTEKTILGLNTVANKFELSPHSTTSSSWGLNWPIKPEVVFEGGNLIRLENGDIDGHDDLEVLTTSSNSITHHFKTFNATSAATAFAANFLAKLRNMYPDAWPETLRALMIHSASWSQEMIDQFDINESKVGDVLKLLKIVGYGIPNLHKALACKSNYLTFISEQTITPYKLEAGDIKSNEIHYYEFPWPKEILENLGDANVTLRVTLSYYIEPNPGDRGYTTKYAYQSTALKFSLINSGEDFDNFKIRTNKINQDVLKENLGVPELDSAEFDKNTGNSRWALGADTVFKGSIHSNYWNGSAAEISACNKLAIFPLASGWWKQLKKQNKYNSQLRYSLIVSIETPENTDDIYTPIATQVTVENLVVV